MKQIALLLPLSLFLLIIQSCQSGSEANSDGSKNVFSAKKSNDFKGIEEGPVYTFSVVPDQYSDCQAVFSQSEDELAGDQFLFATDMHETCVIALEGRLIQLEMVAKRTANLEAQFYKFEGKGYTIDLEIRQTEKVGPKLKKVRGQLKISDRGGYRDVFYIMGEVKC